MIAGSILAIVALLAWLATASSASTINFAESTDNVQTAVRDVMNAMVSELQLASKQTNPAFMPPLQTVQVNNNPAPACPIEIVFQTPLDGTGQLWSRQIRFRFHNEDTNANGQLDPGEDLNGDGLLNRRVLRIFDRNGDGDTTDAGESVPVAGVNCISNVAFAQNGDVWTITLTATQLARGQRLGLITAQVRSDAYLHN